MLGDIGRGLPFFPRQVPDWSRPIILALLLLALGLAIRLRFVRGRASRLERQREALLDDLDVLQRALVPDVPERLGGLPISVAYRPAEGPGAGGDFYDAFQLADGRVGVLLGDVSGHGREALERAALMRYTLRAYLEAGLDPRATLKVAGRVLAEDASDAFATVAVAVFDASAGVLTYALAGHHPPVVLAPDAPEPVGASACAPLGMGLPTGLRQTTISLPGEAIVCFFTDGLVEARAGGEMLGREKLAEELAALGPDADAPSLLGRVRDAAEEAPDDMAACVVHLTGGDAAAPVRVEELELAPDAIAPEEPGRFLAACGLTPDEGAAAFATAPDPAEPGAVMRVRFDESGTTVEFCASAPGEIEAEGGVDGARGRAEALVAS